VNSQIIHRNSRLRAIARQRDVVLDWDVAVDDARRDLRDAVDQRDRAARHLEELIALADWTETTDDVAVTA
jgi:hypothetical protein